MKKNAKLIAIRRSNADKAIANAGGAAKVAKVMGYKNASYLSQLFGPNPTRDPSERFMRRLEVALGLDDRSLDRDVMAVAHQATTGPLISWNAPLLNQVMLLVGRIADEETVTLSIDRLAALTCMGYEDAAESSGQVREGKLRQVIQLLR